jgi:hypothetical protein
MRELLQEERVAYESFPGTEWKDETQETTLLHAVREVDGKELRP